MNGIDTEHRSFPWPADSFDGDDALVAAVAWINGRRSQLALAGRVIVSRELREIRFGRVVVATVEHAPAIRAEAPVRARLLDVAGEVEIFGPVPSWPDCDPPLAVRT